MSKIMNIRMNQMIRKRLSVLLLTSLFFTGALHAQNGQPKTEKTNPIATIEAAGELPKFNIEFPGGPPAGLILHIGKNSGIVPNVIIPPHLEKLELPRFKLQNVNARQIFDALNMVVDEKGNQPVRWISEGAKNDPNPVWILMRAPNRSRPENCQVSFIGHLLDSFKMEDINTAIRTAWELLGSDSSATLKFHKETRLLIAKGTDQELKLVQEVIKSLEMATASKSAPAPKKPL